MTNKPISNVKLKRVLPKRVLGISRNKVLMFNSMGNGTIKAIIHPKNYLNKCLGFNLF
jgi:hypothetical protein